MTIGELKKMSRNNVTGEKKMITPFQNAPQIWESLKRQEYKSRSFSKKIAPLFNTGDDLKTCRRVWKFLRVYIRYDAEPVESQTSKTIAKFLVDREGDCKHYATFAVCVLRACGIKSWFCYVRQSKENKNKGHIYAMADVGGEIVVIDPCRENFNDECEFIYRKFIQPKKVA